MSSPIQPTTARLRFPATCLGLRRQLADLLAETRELHKVADMAILDPPAIAGQEVPDVGEMHENIVLAYRHMEDARMRLGKALQAYDGGVSVYDKA